MKNDSERQGLCWLLGPFLCFGLLLVLFSPIAAAQSEKGAEGAAASSELAVESVVELPVLCRGHWQTEEQARAQLARLAGAVKTVDQWKERARQIRSQILRGSGLDPMPGRTPLNAHRLNRRQYNGYCVESVWFEAIPGFLVYGTLYRPDDGPARQAGILCPHGHARGPRGGRLRPDHQHRCATLARMGATVFSYDMVGFGDSGFLGWDHGHDQVMAMQLWTSIRAIDFLLSLGNIAEDRIAVTGASGGGTQSFLLTAVDERIDVSVPVVMVSAHFFGGCTCESGKPIHKTAVLETNNVEIAATCAPRPMLLVSVGGDWTKNTPEVEYPFIKNVYRLFGKESLVENVHFPDEEHGYERIKRQAVYPFLARHLRLDASAVMDAGSGAFDESGNTIESIETMRVFASPEELPGHALKPGQRLDFSVAAD